jgi:hypothetical protein
VFILSPPGPLADRNMAASVGSVLVGGVELWLAITIVVLIVCLLPGCCRNKAGASLVSRRAELKLSFAKKTRLALTVTGYLGAG